jgi:hypothetical protein
MIGAIVGSVALIFVALLVYFCLLHRTTGRFPKPSQVAALAGAAAAAAPDVLAAAAEEGKIGSLTNPMKTINTRNTTRLAATLAPYRSSSSMPSLRTKGINPIHRKGGRRTRTHKQKGGDEMSMIFAIAGPLAQRIVANGGQFNIPELISEIMTML